MIRMAAFLFVACIALFAALRGHPYIALVEAFCAGVMLGISKYEGW